MRTHWHNKQRSYHARYGRQRRIIVIDSIVPSRRLLCRCVSIVIYCIVTFAVCYALIHLACYIKGYFTSKLESDALRVDYYDEPEGLETPYPIVNTSETVALISIAPTETPAPVATLQTDLAQLATLPPISYPLNPNKRVSEQFEKLQRRNKDIIGWLSIEGLLDEAIVQRDNSYYLRRDYLGFHNINGALFLDANCDLSTRPYTYIIYGHNMKTGEMFGNLRKYENPSFYKEHAIITFNTLYENGKYIVFSVLKVDLEQRWHNNYVPVFLLPYSTIKDRDKCIKQLQQLSVHQIAIDVLPTDQLLVLVTCDGEDNTRRLVVARRLREDESQEEIQKIVER